MPRFEHWLLCVNAAISEVRLAAADSCYRYAHNSEAEFAVTAFSSIVVRCLGCLKLRTSGERATYMRDKLCPQGWMPNQHLTPSSSRLKCYCAQMLLCTENLLRLSALQCLLFQMVCLLSAWYSAVIKCFPLSHTLLSHVS